MEQVFLTDLLFHIALSIQQKEWGINYKKIKLSVFKGRFHFHSLPMLNFVLSKQHK